MGLASALSTALTGLNAAETTIDVVGNNLANSNTVGFKASEASFATQFLQTLSLGGAPTDTSGGTNPKQIGLGTVVADITPNFSGGTIETSANPQDMAIQGDGFFIVQGGSGEQLFTRNGEFKLNSENEIVTTTGNRLLGYGVDDNFQIQRTVLVPLEIPLGATAVAQATQNAFLQGSLSPTGDVANVGSIIQTNILGRADQDFPTTVISTDSVERPNLVTEGTTFTQQAAGTGGMMTNDVFEYRIVYAKDDPTGAAGTVEESMWAEQQVTITADNTSVLINNVPNSPDDSSYQYVRIYRKDSNDANFHLIDQKTLGGAGPWTFTDTTAVGGYAAQPNLNTNVLNGEFTYYVTFGIMGADETDPNGNSRPSPLTTDPIRVTNGRVMLSDLPTTTPAEAAADGWNCRRVWRRNNASSDSQWHLVAEVPGITDATVKVIDELPDAGTGGALSQPVLDLDGPRIRPDTLLTEVTLRDGQTYSNVFQEGTLEFTGQKGGRTLSTKNLVINDGTTVQDLLTFMEEAMGIQKATGVDPETDIPPDSVTGNQPGGYIQNGRMSLLGDSGKDNALSVGLSGLLLKTAAGQTVNVDLPWQQTQAAVGESAVTDFVAYDSLGIPIQVRLTAVLERKDDTTTTYRWFADSPNNDPADPVNPNDPANVSISVGTGLITFDGEGNFIEATNSTVSVDRRHVASASPLEFNLDFSQISGLATSKSSLSVSRQDGSGAGTLTSFIVGEDGIISGVFSNGVTRDLGMMRLARFANPAGLEQRGQNLYSQGVNSGLPVMGDPGQQGIGTIVAGAIELSNTDIGGDLVRLILASTMYRGNARVITTSQDMLDELLNLRR